MSRRDLREVGRKTERRIEMFEKLDIGVREKLLVLEVDTDGRWVSNRYWAILYPEHVLTVDEMMAKAGRYYANRDGKYEWYDYTEATMKNLFPPVSHKGTELLRRLMYDCPLTVDYAQRNARATAKCYILDPCHPQVDEIPTPILVYKRYFDKIRRLHPDAKVFGSTLNRPIFFGKHVGVRGAWNWVAALMPVNHLGSIDDHGEDLVGFLAREKLAKDATKEGRTLS